MHSTKKFIEDMVTGGFFGEFPETAEVSISVFEGTTPSYHTDASVAIDGHNYRATIAAWLINPEVWQAVARARNHRTYQYAMIAFMTSLADGRSIEQALSALE